MGTRLLYLSVLVGCLLSTAPLPWLLRVKVWGRWRRLVRTLPPVVAAFTVWDAYAIGAGHWSFDPSHVTGIRIGTIPLEEILFFVVVPICGVAAYEAILAGKHKGVPAASPDAASRSGESR